MVSAGSDRRWIGWDAVAVGVCAVVAAFGASSTSRIPLWRHGRSLIDSLPVWVVSVSNVDLKIMSRRTPTDIQWGLVDTTNDWPNIVSRRTMTTPVPAPHDGGAQRATKQPRRDHHVSAKQTSSTGGRSSRARRTAPS